MTGLLIRDTYFPEESRFAEVPPQFVLDLFLNHRDSATTLVLRRGEENLGHSTVMARKQPPVEGQTVVHDLQGSGMVDGRAFGAAGNDLTWRLAGELENGREWRSMIFQTGWRPGEGPPGVREGVSAAVSWKRGGQPVFEVRQGGRVIMNNSKAGSLPQPGSLPLGNLLGPSLGNSAMLANMTQIKAREGAMLLAGKRRKCYILQMQFTSLYEIKMLFTEAGELARIDLPQDWHLLEPTIHGLGATLAD